MLSYIVINCKNSINLNGLIITKLPSITKPRIRSQIEEIDGRDGDIVTKLGYSAYDKEFEIGLSYNYNIDDIISFFDSEGVITFSNEPDKYYNFTILEPINFEKLLRFKKAMVKIHVQPFKYSNIETTKTYNFTEPAQSLTVRNNGNIYSKPVITLNGSGTIDLSLNGYQVFVINLSNAMTINAETMNAYDPVTNIYLNRFIIGDFENMYLKPGANVISWEGNLTQVKLSKISRWL